VATHVVRMEPHSLDTRCTRRTWASLLGTRVKYRIKQEARNAQHIMPDPLTLVYKFNMPRVPPIP
jgi:hypothetical protein